MKLTSGLYCSSPTNLMNDSDASGWPSLYAVRPFSAKQKSKLLMTGGQRQGQLSGRQTEREGGREESGRRTIGAAGAELLCNRDRPGHV